MKIQVQLDDQVRSIKPSRLEEYLAAGWQPQQQEQADGVTRLKPPARVKAAVKEASDNTIDIDKGE